MKIDIDPDWRAWLVNDEVYAACDEGWRDLLRDLLGAFHDVLCQTPDARITVRQVKEKLAGLRFYWRDENVSVDQRKQLFEIYRRVQDLSYRTCEVCGRPGKLRQRGSWWVTRCRDHVP